MRGKGNLSGPFYSRSGITPACAGKRVRQHRRAGGKRDHPRVCGEKGSRYREIIRSMGSPPRVRGKDAVLFYMADPVGITPACAGKSRFQSRPRPVAGDHPRVCGEKIAAYKALQACKGSPPRVRGKGSREGASSNRRRITPACAGKRLKRSHSIGHFSCILCLFHSVLHRASVSGGSRAGPCAPPCLPAQNAVPV